RFSKDLVKLFIKILLSSLIMLAFIVIFSEKSQFFINADVLQRVFSITKTILLSAGIYFVSLYLFGVRVNKL
ncbi:MAG TPA: murein biosynthesis integral membrane protein MurJ, partial [Gammaproteobacteria bacterium]|nr:murein biosynthesis integral membrane protein MurJ [Gammaproteobacteria bacterium]